MKFAKIEERKLLLLFIFFLPIVLSLIVLICLGGIFFVAVVNYFLFKDTFAPNG